MLVVENQGLPIGGLVASAQKAEVKLAEPTLAIVKVPRPCGRPRTRPKELVADKGYDSGPLRSHLRRRGIKPCIPERRGKKPRPGRKADLAGYGQRWKVERTYAWLSNYRRLVVRMAVPYLPGYRAGGVHPDLLDGTFEITCRSPSRKPICIKTS
jgi:transposase